MSLTKIGSIGINTGIQFAGVTTIATLNASDNVLSVGGTVNFVSDVSIGGTVSIAGTLTYEDVTNVDAVGLITARNGIKVGSGITLSPDGDIFAVGVSTFTGAIDANGNVDIAGGLDAHGNVNLGDASSDTITAVGGFDSNLVPSADSTYDLGLTGTRWRNAYVDTYYGDGSNLTGLAAGGAFIKGVVGVTTLTPVGIETSTVTRKDLIGPGGNTATGAGSSFHGAYMGDGFLSFNTEFSNPTGYYISTFTNALVAGPMSLGSTMTIDGNFTIV